MLKILSIIIAVFFVFFSFPQSTNAQTRLFVRFKKSYSSVEKQNLHLRALVKKVYTFKTINNLESIEFATNSQADKAFELYKKNPHVFYVERDQQVRIADTPNDERFAGQWGLQNTEIFNNAINDVDINAPEAWEVSTGSSDLVIGVIDTGIDYNHSDLFKNLWINPQEIANNQIDDDNNGYIDDVYGINTINHSGDPTDDHNHGTHVSGIIAATGNNQIGISGVMQKAQIISCKFMDSSGSGNLSDAISCLDYFNTLDSNMVATNNSWGGIDYSQALYDAIFTHLKRGILFITAAGNNNFNNDDSGFYPGNYALPNVIAVAAIDQSGNFASFSNYGHYRVHTAAPGANILSTIIQGYNILDGTSMATPFVTGVSGLLKANDPRSNWIDIKNRIIASGKPLKSLTEKTLTGKLLRAYDDQYSGAMNCENQILTTHISPPSKAISVSIGSPILLSAININCGNPLGNMNATIDNKTSFIIPDDGRGKDLVASDGINTKEWTPDAPGTYHLAFSKNDQILINVYDPHDWQKYESIRHPSFEYYSIQGTHLNDGDETVSLLESPFPLLFASNHPSHFILYVGSNGTISLTDRLLPNFYNLTLPQAKWISLIAPYWDDLKPIENDPNSGIFYDVLDEKPQRKLVIEWRNMRSYDSTNDNLTFQVVFFENSPDILFNYLNVDSQNTEHENGNSATIGIQTQFKLFKLFSWNTASISSHSSLLFQIAPQPQSEKL